MNLKEKRLVRFKLGRRTADDVLSVLSTGEAMPGENILIDGKEVPAEQAVRNLQKALGVVNQRVGHLVGDLDLDNLEFEVMEGNIVGRSTKDGIKIDPIMLMHPAMRLAYAIGHEMFHHGEDVANEDLVDAMVEAYFSDVDLASVYEGQLIRDLAETCEITVDEVYQMYLQGKFGDLYRLYIDGLAEKGVDSTTALGQFRALFPELTHVRRKAETDAPGWGYKAVRTPDTIQREIAGGVQEEIAEE